ncbi:hypothetical protein FRX31_023043 [Thalictrum thalictroides]|uniref:RNase H type-1 domain-containing protein n=1 Tax=Thalictrum thalictroides TaxID=46969 RepID=A0A7J6VT57_THATH|nr:hypothetical protein FRX31_023043 [Thalictrum thalictroides]
MVIGNGHKTDLWRDAWIDDESLKDSLQLQKADLKGCRAKVCDVMINGQMVLEGSLLDIIEETDQGVHNIVRTHHEDEDYMVWRGDEKGKFSVASAYEVIRQKGQKVAWHNIIWKNHIHPTSAGSVWKLIQGCAATNDRLQKMGIQLASQCQVCHERAETLDHLLWDCRAAKQLWGWAAREFGVNGSFSSFMQAFKVVKHSLLIRTLWQAAVVGIAVSLWRNRNKIVFDGGRSNEAWLKMEVRRHICFADRVTKGGFTGSSREEDILARWGLAARVEELKLRKECKWYPPEALVIKINCDGASKGNPGQAGLGCVFRDCHGFFLLVKAKGIGFATNYEAECGAIMEGLEEAVKRGWLKVWVESDSTAAIQAFAHGSLPWRIAARWKLINSIFQFCLFSHNLREANFSADQAAKKGASLNLGEELSEEGKPPWIVRWENPDQVFVKA